jgi:thioesterase domain-containing protein
VQAGGELPPLCAIHGGDGGILFYQSLAGRLPVERPFLAIESPELSSSAALEVGTVEATATRYIRLLKQARRAGPYLLAGYSFGGVVAYEMARQLVEAGDEVSFLGLIDTLNPAISVRAYSLAERVAVFWDARHAEPLPRRLWSLAKRFRGGIQTNLRVKAELAAAARCEHAAAHSELRGVQLREAHYRAMKAYRPLPYAGTLTLFRASEVSDKFEFPEDYGWRGLPAELRVVEVAGEHLTIFEDAHIEPLAREFARHLPPPATSGQAASTSASANERVDAGQNVGQVIHSAIP